MDDAMSDETLDSMDHEARACKAGPFRAYTAGLADNTLLLTSEVRRLQDAAQAARAEGFQDACTQLRAKMMLYLSSEIDRRELSFEGKDLSAWADAAGRVCAYAGAVAEITNLTRKASVPK